MIKLGWRCVTIASVFTSMNVGCAIAAPGTEPATPAGPFLEQVESYFAAWDTNHDGTLSFDEIEVAVDDANVKGPTAAAAATLRMRAVLRGKTLTDYRELLTKADAGQSLNEHEAGYAAALKKLGEIDHAVFPAGLPKGSQVAQGKLGDCFLLASVGTLAQTDPQRMKSLVSESGDGKVTVKFGDGKPVTLPVPTDAEMIIGSTTRSDGVWSNVFEKAIGRRMLDNQKTGKHLTPYSIIGVGGTPNVPLAMLTGHKVAREGCEMFQKPGLLDEAGKAKRLDEIRNALESALKEHRLIVGGTADIKGPEVKVKGLWYDHSYGVLGYDRETDLVTFWNPMSNAFTPKGEPGLTNGYPTSFGRFDCPLKEAVMWFGSWSIEQNEPLETKAPK